MTCQGSRISASIFCSWCSSLSDLECYSIPTYPNREPNNFRRRTNTPRYVATLSSGGLLTTLQFLARNNGSSNAFTSSTNTNYYFNVATPALAGALERFSGFFHSPLFSPSSIIRELNAVDSEHKKNSQNDRRRASQVNKHLSKPGHVWSKFGTGNKVTLTSAARKLFQKGVSVKSKAIDGCASFQATGEGPSVTSSTLPISSPPIGSGESLESSDDGSGGAISRETRRRLIEWWSKEYCAGRMRLCVIGKGMVFCVWA